MQALIAFVRLADADPQLQALIAQADHPGVIVSIGAGAGCGFTVQDLRQISRDLSADYWPWAAKGHVFRRNWFAQAS